MSKSIKQILSGMALTLCIVGSSGLITLYSYSKSQTSCREKTHIQQSENPQP